MKIHITKAVKGRHAYVELKNRLGIDNDGLIITALTPCTCDIGDHSIHNNNRIEWLGDVVINLVIAYNICIAANTDGTPEFDNGCLRAQLILKKSGRYIENTIAPKLLPK